MNRRDFLTQTGFAACGAAVAHANPFGLPLGLQLYSVREQLAEDYPGTLKTVASLGYREVEAAGFFDKPPAEVKSALQAAGLKCVSAHYSASQMGEHLLEILDFHKQLGTVEYIVCSFPGFPPGNKAASLPHHSQLDAFTLDVWKWNAGQFNAWARVVKDQGFKFAYHNHTMEFRPQNGTVPFDQLARETDPALVAFELDCGWVQVGGGSPEHYLHAYANRSKMQHVKDFAQAPGHSTIADPPPAAELGRGTSKYREILAAAKPGAIEHIFVEQESYPDLPWQEALGVDARYMKALKA